MFGSVCTITFEPVEAIGKACDSCFQLLPSFGASRLKDSLNAALGTCRFSVNVFVSNWSEIVVMADIHCRIRTPIRTCTRIPVLYKYYGKGSESGSEQM